MRYIAMKLDCILKKGDNEKRKIINCPNVDTIIKCLSKIADINLYDKIECR